MITAAIQINANNKQQQNLDKSVHMVEEAILKKAKFILLPEVFLFRGKIANQEELSLIAEKIPGKTTDRFSSLAKRTKSNILLGSIYEKAKTSKKVYNTSVLIGADGKIKGKYRKKHLFTAVVDKKTIKESQFFIKGKSLFLTNMQQFTIGFSICYDIRFSSMYNFYARKGADVLCVPSNFLKETGQAHWETLLRTRAIENFCYVLAPNQVGKGFSGQMAYGNSMIVDPWGKVIARASEKKEEIIFADIKKENIISARKQLPGISNYF